MARTPRKARKSRSSRVAAAAGTPPALDFTDGDERGGRIGDPAPALHERDQFPRRRVREAGSTAGETAHPERNTADDAAPDTLLDQEGGMSPADQRGPRAADTTLSVVDASAIGAGGGPDESEEADVSPISREEHARLQRRIARAGGPLRNVEPYETQAGNPGRERNRNRP